MSDNMQGSLFVKALAQVIRKDWSALAKLPTLVDLLINISKTSVKNTGIQFHTIFSIIAYTGHQYNLPGKLLFNIHRFRRDADKWQQVVAGDPGEIEKTYRLGLKIISDLNI